MFCIGLGTEFPSEKIQRNSPINIMSKKPTNVCALTLLAIVPTQGCDCEGGDGLLVSCGAGDDGQVVDGGVVALPLPQQQFFIEGLPADEAGLHRHHGKET
jgi:hypothetical protein